MFYNSLQETPSKCPTIGCSMSDSDFLNGHLLIAMPALDDPNFFHSVTFICEHNSEGAMGITLNRGTTVTVGEVITQLGYEWPEQDMADLKVYQGGPVETERGFVIHQPLGEWDSTVKVDDQTGVTSSRDILEAISKGEGPERVFIALGYAGWGPGQLEKEMAANAWLSAPFEPEIIFSVEDDQRWEAAAKSVGVDLNLLSNDVGHA